MEHYGEGPVLMWELRDGIRRAIANLKREDG